MRGRPDLPWRILGPARSRAVVPPMPAQTRPSLPRWSVPALLVACAPVLQAQAPAESPKRASRVLLVGCTEYPYLKAAGHVPGSNTIELRGPVNDVELFARTLTEVHGVPASSMTRLAGWPADEAARPTKANIVRALQRLGSEAKKGDWVVIYLAGHGSQQPSSGASLDDETDGLDEIFLPADVRPAPDGTKVPNALTDDEIAEWVARIRAKDADVWLVVDACHSGTLLRGGDWVVRGLPSEMLGVRGAAPVVAPAAPAPATAAHRAPTDGVVAFYGAQSFGSAPEMELPRDATDARPQGLFTYLLAREMRRVGGAATYSELAQRVIAAYQAFPCHLTVPLAEGDLGRMIGSGERAPAPPLLLSVGNGPPRLAQGLLNGLEPGVVLDVAPPDDPDGEPVARVEIVRAGLYDAECALRSGALPDEAVTCRARIVERSLSEFRLSIAVVAPDERPLGLDALPENVRADLQREAARFPLVDPARADWRVVVDGDVVHLRAAGHVGVADRLDVRPVELRRTLDRLLKVHNLRRLCGLFAASDAALDVRVERRSGPRAAPADLAPGDVLRPGDEVRVRLRKQADAIYDVTVLYLDANYGVQCLFPAPGRPARLEREANKDFELTGWIGVTDDALGLESLWVLAVPRGPSDPEVNLSELAQDQVPLTRGALEKDAAARVFQDLLRGTATRGIAPGAGAPPAGSVYQVPVTTAWPPLAAPGWGAGPVQHLAKALPALSDLPMAFDPGPCWTLATSAAPRANGDVLLVGDEGAPRAVLIDFDGGRGAGDPQVFEPEAAFLFLEGGARLALYDRRDRGGFDLALLDGDGDGLSERRWTRGEAGWILQDLVATPWLSQAHLSFLRDKLSATARLSVLALR